MGWTWPTFNPSDCPCSSISEWNRQSYSTKHTGGIKRPLYCGHATTSNQHHPKRLAILRQAIRTNLYFASWTSICHFLSSLAVPSGVEHTIIWTRLPIINASIIPEMVYSRVKQDGLWGFTGSSEPPPPPSTFHSYLPVLDEWGVTMESLTLSPKGTEEEDEIVRQCGKEVDCFVRKFWKENEWETAWFVNPEVWMYFSTANAIWLSIWQRIQSVPGLSHIHVFARRRSQDEIAAKMRSGS